MPLTQAQSIWRDAQIEVESISVASEEDAIRWVEKTIIPGAVSYIEGRLQECSLPFTYPLDISTLKKAYPKLPTHALQKILDGWDAQKQDAIKFQALCNIFSLVDTTKEEWQKRADRLCATADKLSMNLESAIEKVLDRLPDSETGGRFGMLVVKLPDRKFGENEYANEY